MTLRYLALLLLALSPFTYAQESDEHWYTPPQKDLVYLQTHTGEVVIMLSHDVSPVHVQRFTDLVDAGFYDGKYFYRVIEGFVAQAGSNQENQEGKLTSPLTAEFVSPLSDTFTLVEDQAPFAPQTGFLNGMPAGVNTKTNQQWLLHCPGTLAFARGSDKDSATTEFYIVIGQAPRHLDKNMSVIGRVLTGMQHLQQLPRGEREQGGVIASPGDGSLIKSAATGGQLSESARRHFRVQRASHPTYQQKLALSRGLDNPFFYDKSLSPRTIDVCYYQTEVQEITAKSD